MYCTNGLFVFIVQMFICYPFHNLIYIKSLFQGWAYFIFVIFFVSSRIGGKNFFFSLKHLNFRTSSDASE